MNIPEFISLLTHTEAPANPAAIHSFEVLIGADLPADYRHFLSLTNGGFLPSGEFPNALVFDNSKTLGPKRLAQLERGPYPQDYRPRAAAVAHIFGLRDRPCFSLVWHFEEMGVPLPEDLIEIMDDGSGNHICLGISGPVYGKVHFHDCGDTYLLADSFSSFISGLRPWDEVM
jgi:hypothetical protein